MSKKKQPKQIDENQYVIDTITSRFGIAKEAQTQIFTNFTKYYDYYTAVLDSEKKNNYRSTLKVPYIKQIVDTILPRLVSSKPKINVLPVEDTDIGDAQAMEKFVDWQWEKLRLYQKIKQWVKTALIYGVGILKLGWDYDEEVADEDKPWVELVSNYDVFKSPNTSTLDGEWVIFKQERDLAEVKKNKKYINLDKLEGLVGIDSDTNKNKELSSRGLSAPKKDGRKKVVLYEYYGKLSLKEDEEEKDYFVVLANNEVVLRIAPLDEVSPCGIPFVALFDDPMPLDFWATGEVQPLMALQDELDTLRRQRLDNRNLIINHMWLVNKDGGVNWDDFVSRPGGIIECADINAVKPLPVNDTSGSSVQEESIVKQDMDRTSGIFPGMMGQMQLPPGVGSGDVFTQTKGGFLAAIEQAGTKLQYKLDNLDDAIRELGQKLLKLDAAYIDKEQIIRIVGKNGVKFETIKPEILKKEYDLRIEGGTTQPKNREATIRKYAMALNSFAPFTNALMFQYELGSPPIPTKLNLQYFLKNMIDEMEMPNSEEAFINLQEIAPPPMMPGSIPNPNETIAPGGGGGAQLAPPPAI